MTQPELPSKSGIYQIVCRSTKKAYIGKAINIRRRWGQHKATLAKGTHRSPRLQHAWNKYGADDFYCEVLELVDRGQEALLIREQWHLDARKARTGDKEYNICEYAYGPLGVKRTAEARLRMSLAHKGKPMSQRQLQSLRGRKMPPLNERQRMILAQGNAKAQTPEGRANQAESRRRRLREQGFTEAEKAYHKRRCGRKATDETRAKQSENIRRAYQDPALKERFSQAMREAWARRKAAKNAPLAQPPLFPPATSD